MKNNMLKICLAILILLLCVLSLYIGSGNISFKEVTEIIFKREYAGTEAAIIWQLRLPRTFVALLTGAALGMAGSLTQSLTRNPLAEPGLLGINSGAGLMVAAGIVFFRVNTIISHLFFALMGSVIAGILVLFAGGVFSKKYNSVRLILAGAAISAIAGSSTSYLIMSNEQVFAEFRHWNAGAVTSRPLSVIIVGAVFLIIALILISPNFSSIDALYLGEDMGRALGANPGKTWAISGLTAVLLCSVSVSLAGPISFLGLAAPKLVKWHVGPSSKRLTLWSGFMGACTLLAADIIGRIIVPPGEVSAAVVCGLAGAPLFVLIAKKIRLVAL